MDYLILTLGSLLLAVDFSFNKLFQGIYGAKPKSAFLFNMLAGGFAAVIFFIINGCRFNVTPFSLLMAGFASLLAMSYNIIGFKLLKSGTMAMYTLFLMTGGMTLPYIWGLLFLDEPFKPLRMVGLAVIIGGVVLSNFTNERFNLKQLLMCIAVFVINGFVSITSKMHQVNTSFKTVNTTEFVVLQGFCKLLIAGIIYLVLRSREERSENGPTLKKAVIIAFCSALFSGMFSLLQLTVAQRCPASVLYPFNTGLTIIMSSLAGVIVFKERLSKKSVLGIALCFIGTVMFL